MMQFVTISHLQELIGLGRVTLTCHPVLRKLRQGDYSKFKDSLDCRMRSYLKRHIYQPVSPSPPTHSHAHTHPQNNPPPTPLSVFTGKGYFQSVKFSFVFGSLSSLNMFRNYSWKNANKSTLKINGIKFSLIKLVRCL